MKRFWSKKLPALVLAMTMAIGLATPAALAVDHNYNSQWSTDATYHWHACTDAGCTARGDYEEHDFGGIQVTNEPTCYQEGKGVRTCQTCGYEKTESIAATGKHTAAGGWTSDGTTHWHACTAASGCTARLSEAQHTFPSGEYVTNSSYHWQVCTICGGSSAKTAHVDNDFSGACDACSKDMPVSAVTVTFKNGSSTYATQTVAKGGTPSNPGTPTKTASGKTYTFKGWTTSNPGTSAIYDGQTVLSSSKVATTAVTANTTYYAVYTVSSSSDISYAVSAGKSVDFDPTDFKSAYQEEYAGTPRWVEFDTRDTLSSSKGAVYYDYGGSDEKLFSASTIDDNKFYYSSSSYGDYALEDLSFAAPEDAAERTVELDYTVYYSSSKYVTGTLTVKITGSADADGIEYQLDPGEEVAFRLSDFKSAYQEEYSGTPRWVEFDTDDTLSKTKGAVYYDYGGSDEKLFSASAIDDEKFYYSDSSYGDYALSDLSFVAPKDAAERTVTLNCTIHYSASKYVETTVTITIGDAKQSTKADITYEVTPGDDVAFKPADFRDLYQKEYSGTPRWVRFETDDNLSASRGAVYIDHGGSKEKLFSASTIDDSDFYYSDSSYGDYALDDLSFVAPESAAERTVTLKCTVYYSASKYVEGTVAIVIGSASGSTGSFGADIRYNTTYNTNLQINANDIARLFRRANPTSTLQYVRLGGVPESGSLYYNYYGASQYGPKKTLLTSSNRSAISFYFSPTSTSQYALSELTYVPGKANVCDLIPFTAYGSNSKTLSGTILVSTTLTAVSDVYGVTPKNTTVTFPASAISNAILAATGTSLGSIRLLSLPAASVGKVYVGSGTSVKADTETLYTYAGGSKSISDLRFVPATGYTGSVEIPYVAYNKSGTPIASGKFCLGIVTSLKKFSDVNSSTWCYKYVAELSDAGVISGYSDSSFRPNNTVTYGAALKLIMLAAGYPEQKPTGANVFSGYLTKARADGIITRSNVDLSAPITRLQAAQLAAGALKLDTSSLSSIQPFTDTTDASVRALNAAGIVEGYFSNGKSTFKPGNTLTRGQVSAIVWRMNQLSK